MTRAGYPAEMSFRESELWEPETRLDPHSFYARVRATGRPVPQVDPAGSRFWIIARYADVLEALHHPDIGHEVHRHTGDRQQQRSGQMTEIDRINSRQLISLDPPEHSRLRKLVNTAFKPRTVARLEPWIVEIVDELIARARQRGVIDGIADLGDPVPVAVIAELIGVPEEDRPRFRRWSATIMSGKPIDRDAATLEFAAFIDDLAARRRADPHEDLLSELVALEDQGNALDRDELVAMIQLLLIAGQETAVYTIANGLRLLLTHPEPWRDLRDDPSLAGAAVEEVLRFDGPVELAPPRFAFTDLEFGGGTIPAFERVGISLLGANRDPEVFSHADVFDIHRADLARHLGFGHGIHFCLGAPLGRLESRIMFERIAVQLPDLRLAADPAETPRLEPHTGQLPLRV